MHIHTRYFSLRRNNLHKEKSRTVVAPNFHVNNPDSALDLTIMSAKAERQEIQQDCI